MYLVIIKARGVCYAAHMFKKVLQILSLSLAIGFLFTGLGILAVDKTASQSCPDIGMKDVQRGYPLPYIKITPSTSLCNSVESMWIFTDGNAGHQESYRNFGIDIALWSMLAFCIIQASKTFKT